MKNQTIRYQNFILDPCSYQLAVSKKWVPQLMLGEDRLNEVMNTPLSWDKEFDAREDANTYAIKQAEMFIDKKSGSQSITLRSRKVKNRV